MPCPPPGPHRQLPQHRHIHPVPGVHRLRVRADLPRRTSHRLAGGAPFTALQILLVNPVMDGPPAMSLGIDPVGPDAMSRPPRPAGERIPTRRR
ncbi:cation-translocating P-type ATPase C-terminal domain-containing protein [Nonomuraea sp. NPDC050691]|uniref:cation-translocating P-type ATPase C-terminal domain-containing protein n=1 Tax=Nonomuraea sp. NPDC050691 TaxID=3155661 RepID=UPI0033E7BF25